MSPTRKRYPLNVTGDFYVEDWCCTLCGVPASTAPGLFGGFNVDGTVLEGADHCWVRKQPASDQELDAMLNTMAAQELNCVRYDGSDASVIERLALLGEADQVDHR